MATAARGMAFVCVGLKQTIIHSNERQNMCHKPLTHVIGAMSWTTGDSSFCCWDRVKSCAGVRGSNSPVPGSETLKSLLSPISSPYHETIFCV